MVFTSDAKSRWAADWVTWKGFDQFWTNIFRDLLAARRERRSEGRFRQRQRRPGGELSARRAMSAAPAKLPAIFIFGPGGFHHPLPVTELADQGLSRIAFTSANCRGCFAFGRWKNRALFLKSGSTGQEQELLDYGSNPISAALDRAVYRRPLQSSSPARCSMRAAVRNPPRCGCGRDCWRLAIALNLAELIMRKGKAVFDSFFAKPAAAHA